MQDGPILELTPPNQSYIPFPDEILFQILNFASFSDLCYLESVSQQFKGLVQEKVFWKNLLHRYFPYVFEVNAQGCKDNPKQVFKEQFQYYQSFTKTSQYGNLVISLILSALQGNLKAIKEAKTNSIAKKFLTVLAAAHGSNEAWDKLAKVDKIDALTHTARMGYLTRFQTLIKKMTKISKEDYTWFLEKATENNQEDVVNYLLENYGFCAIQLEKAMECAKEGHDNIVETLQTRIYLLNLGMRDERDILPTYATIVGKVLNPENQNKKEQDSLPSYSLAPNRN